jgi:hypothetical protein
MTPILLFARFGRNSKIKNRQPYNHLISFKDLLNAAVFVIAYALIAGRVDRLRLKVFLLSPMSRTLG